MVAPKLRFQEFDGDWAKSKLGDEAQFFQGEQVSLDDQYSEYSSGLTKFLRIENFTQKSKDFRYIKYSGSPEKILTETDIAIVRYGATAGFICSGETGVIANNLFKASVDNTKINQKYLELVLKSEKTFNYFQTAMSGGAMPALNFKIVGNLDITYSSILEQTKIASFLSAVDEKIAQLAQKLHLLGQYKQGIMQKLFSQKIRFKADDGSEFGEWEIQSLGNISTHIGGTALESYVDESGTYNFISIGNYSVNGKYIDNSQRIVLNQKTATKLLNKGDLVMVLNDKTASGDLIGSTILINEDNKYIYNQRSERIICNHSNVIPIYLWHFLNAEIMRSEVRKLAQGGTQIYINFGSVLSINFFLPCLEEQTKIANFLSTIDQKIDVASEQLEQAKLWKKGLLQQMFV